METCQGKSRLFCLGFGTQRVLTAYCSEPRIRERRGQILDKEGTAQDHRRVGWKRAWSGDRNVKIFAFWLLFWRMSSEQRGFAALKSSYEARHCNIMALLCNPCKVIQSDSPNAASLLRLCNRKLFVLGYVLIVFTSPKYRLL